MTLASRSPTSDRSAKLALGVFSICLTLAAAEVLVRWLPGSERSLSTAEIWRAQSTRPYAPDGGGLELAGERYREDPVPERAYAEGATRLLFLGDSFTVGAGLEHTRDRFTDRVEAALDTEFPQGLHVFNAAAAEAIRIGGCAISWRFCLSTGRTPSSRSSSYATVHR